ncbi:sensor histidine kinase [Streptomyces sp. NPDC001941]|uniref:sensor histidine kinase n=1 Tax=Streptomyces sp. NPDC001941 TaxID=3154659 RepID=UPI0033243C85
MRIRPLAADVLITVALTAVAVLLGRESGAQGWVALDPLGYALVVLANVPLAARSKAPVAICLFVHLVWAVYITLGHWPVVNCFGPMLAAYTVAVLRPVRAAVACGVLEAVVWIYGGLLAPHASMSSVVAQAVGFPAVILRFGHLTRRADELARELRREQDARARREVAEERGRIARELHDVVAHHMSVISIQAGLATFVFTSDPDTARAALTTISGTSGEALDELRRMLRLLRFEDDEAPFEAPMPGLARLEEMVERVRGGGVPVELRVEGDPRPLAPGVELCAYRVVQEALTNVLKHARGARATVRLVYRARHLDVCVVNDGPGAVSDRVVTGSGHGLIGMRERAKLYGGTISIGPRSEGGFAVRLTLPTSERSAPRGNDTTP